mgnify:FL=1
MRELLEIVNLLSHIYGFNIEPELLQDLIKYQILMIKDPYLPQEFCFNCDYVWHQYFDRVLSGDDKRAPIIGPVTFTVKTSQAYNGDLERWAREHVWFGRKSAPFLHGNINAKRLDR